MSNQYEQYSDEGLAERREELDAERKSHDFNAQEFYRQKNRLILDADEADETAENLRREARQLESKRSEERVLGDRLRNRISHIDSEIRKRQRPPEPGGDHVIMEFSWTSPTNGKVYDYAALKAAGRWYTTGSTCPPYGYSWENLIAFIREGERTETALYLSGMGVIGRKVF
jgi:hypothetical protein